LPVPAQIGQGGGRRGHQKEEGGREAGGPVPSPDPTRRRARREEKGKGSRQAPPIPFVVAEREKIVDEPL